MTEQSELAEANRHMTARILEQDAEPIPRDGYAFRVLEAAGRRTGRLHRTPLGVLGHGDAEYLVCPDRTRDWPRNLLAQPRCVLRAGNQVRRVLAVPAAGADEAADVVAAYLAAVRVPWAKAAFAVPDDASRDDLLAAVRRMAVFRAEPDEPRPGN